MTTSEEAGHEGLPANCPADRLLRLLWGEWTTHILWVLGREGPQRFVRLRGLVEGVSPRMLTARLRRMEADGLIWRDYERTTPPKATYGLTERGKEIHAVLGGLETLAARWFEDTPRY
ncbi:MAG: winged helix-turn-helix transcriptional regulator [Inquilinaceae bacterium]